MIDRLMDIVHASHVNIRGFYRDGYDDEVYYPSPSSELRTELTLLSPNSRVAIDYSPAFAHPFMVRGKIVIPPLQYTNYWQKVEEVCRENGHKIIHFENPALVREEVRLQLDHTRLSEMLGNAPDGEVEQKLRNDLYRVHIESNYLEYVLRDREILNMIKNTKPDAAVIRKDDYTEVLLLGESESKRRLIEGTGAGSRSATRGLQIIPFVKGHTYYLLSTGVTADGYETLSLAKDFILRRYRALNEGRVTHGKPVFIGTWDTQIPAQGLFEIYPDAVVDNEFSGTIEDTYGTATFQGELDGRSISFTKTYIPEKSSESAAKCPIIYRGYLQGQKYKGRYEFQNFEARFPGGDFVMEPFSKPGRSTR